MKTNVRSLTMLSVLLVATAVPAYAQGSLASNPGLTGFSPQVPVSMFARAASWFDPGRLSISTSMSVGSGFSGGTHTLGVTTLSYAFEAPVSMSVSLGNNLGSGSSGTDFFLEGLHLSYRPTANTQFHIDYRNVRSPLQYRYGLQQDPWGAPY